MDLSNAMGNTERSAKAPGPYGLRPGSGDLPQGGPLADAGI